MKRQSKRSKKRKSSKKKHYTPTNREVASKDANVPEKKLIKQKPARNIEKRVGEKNSGTGHSIPRFISKVGQFLREARAELKKVKWPTRKELLASTAVVIVLSILVSIFLGLVDFGLIKIIKNVVG